MNVDQQTWHYKMISRYKGWPPNNLCPYMRSLFVSFLILGLLGGLGLMFGMFVIEICGEIYFAIAHGAWIKFWGAVGDPNWNVPVGVLLLLLLSPIIVITLINDNWHRIEYTFLERFSSKKEPSEEPSEEPKGVTSLGLIIGWLKSIHKGLCPHIDFYDSKNKDKSV